MHCLQKKFSIQRGHTEVFAINYYHFQDDDQFIETAKIYDLELPLLGHYFVQ